VAIVAAEHRLAGSGPVCRADLADEPVPRWPDTDELTAAYWAGLDGASWQGERPDRRQVLQGPLVRDVAQLLEVVALGQAVAFLPASSADRHASPDIVTLPVVDLSPSTVAVAWPEDCRSLAVAAFVRAACDMARREPEAVARLA
jgi:DNA-binding transcriptional LysR family regulator